MKNFQKIIIGIFVLVVVFIVYYFSFYEPKNPLDLKVQNNVNDIMVSANHISEIFSEPIVIEIDSSSRRRNIILKSFIMGIENEKDKRSVLENVYVDGLDRIGNIGSPFIFDGYLDESKILGKYNLFNDLFVVKAGTSERLAFTFTETVRESLTGKKFIIPKVTYTISGDESGEVYEQELDFSVEL